MFNVLNIVFEITEKDDWNNLSFMSNELHISHKYAIKNDRRIVDLVDNLGSLNKGSNKKESFWFKLWSSHEVVF